MAAPRVSPVQIPAGFTVWAGSDLHGQLAAVDRLLERAGLTDGHDRWIAPPRTALVITGDMGDRGPDSLGLVRRLVSLRAQAPARDGMVVLLEGNHEIQVLGGLDGEPTCLRAMLTFGGGATLQSAGLRPDEWEGRASAEIAARLDELAPDLRPALWSFAPYARRGDLLFVHGGPVPGQTLAEFEARAERLWIRSAFFDSADPFPATDAWASYRDAGIGRVVFGHTPVAGPSFSHEGRALNLDTWRSERVTLARLEPARDLRDATYLTEAAEPRMVPDTPVPAQDVSVTDAAMPAVVGAWWRVAKGPEVASGE